MDNVDIRNFERDIGRILVSHKRLQDGIESEDEVENLKRNLGESLADFAYSCEGYNEYSLNQEAIREFEDVGLGTVEFNGSTPILVINDPDDEDVRIEVMIWDPTQEYPD